MENNIKLTEEEKQFLIECIRMAARESYYAATSFGYYSCGKLGFELATKLGADKDMLEEIEIG